ncbi:MAG: peptidylprolyl isomerase [Planctomycetota bacterium]|nr:peptidylprolyl isomerase [Planctomycetota bacterium]
MGRYVWVLTLAAAIAGCQTDWQSWNRSGGGVIAPQKGPVPSGAYSPPPAPGAVNAAPTAPAGVPPAVAAAPRPVVALPAATGQPTLATVNGKPIPLTKLTDILIAAYGLPVSRDIIYLELVEQDAASKSIAVSDADVQAEHERTLEDRFAKLGPKEQWESLFGQILAQNNISRKHWMLIARRNALLRRLAPREIPVKDEETRDAYAKLYGRKVQIRHIESASLGDVQDVLARLNKGADFAQLAKEVSLSNDRSAGGLLPPFTSQTPDVPPLMRQVAFTLKAPGALSDPIQVGGAYHVLKLEKVIEPELPYDQVKNEIARVLRNEKLRVWGNGHLAALTAAADVEFVEPALKALYEENLKAAKEQAKTPEETHP